MAKKLTLVQDERGCITPSSHKLNKDGYFRKNMGGNVFVMYHRHVWESTKGPIPEGYEINHKCKNRACCNIEHLECLEGTDHAVLTNVERYARRKEEAYSYWVGLRCTGKHLAEIFEVDQSSACGWIREWKKTL